MMLPQPYHSSETSCRVSSLDASVIKLPPAESSVDTVIAAASEDAAAATSQNALARSGNKRVSSRLSSSSTSSARYTPTIPQARWSSYTSPLRPISSFATSSVSDEVASLKARLAESEATAEDLMKEKAKVVSASRQLLAGLQNLRTQKIQWIREKDELMEKLRALDEDKVTPVVPPPSEGVWLAGSGEQQQAEEAQSQSAFGRLTVGLSSPPRPTSLRRTFLKWPRIPADPPLSGSLRRQHLKWPRIPASPLLELGPRSTRWLSGAPQDQETRGLEGSLDEARLIPEIRITPPESSGADSGDWSQCIPAMQPIIPPKTPVSASSRQPSCTSPGSPRIAADPVNSRSSRWFSAAPQVGSSQLDLIDLGSQIVGRDPSSESSREIGGDRRGFFSSLGRLGTPWRRPTSDRRFATAEQHATLEFPRNRGPFGIFTHSSSPRGTASEVAGDPQPKRKSRLRKLLKKGRCLISRIE
ncbi:hypothetical protein FRC05_001230 [Tulasnella sp. 425]|nr:hypothetical protein FRC05_001230 [Tulasnella sp. 425]